MTNDDNMQSIASDYAFAQALGKVNDIRQNEAQINTLWQHRNGGYYIVRGVGISEADLTPAIYYETCNPKHPPIAWFRSAEEFLDGRFIKIERTF